MPPIAMASTRSMPDVAERGDRRRELLRVGRARGGDAVGDEDDALRPLFFAVSPAHSSARWRFEAPSAPCVAHLRHVGVAEGRGRAVEDRRDLLIEARDRELAVRGRGAADDERDAAELLLEAEAARGARVDEDDRGRERVGLRLGLRPHARDDELAASGSR